MKPRGTGELGLYGIRVRGDHQMMLALSVMKGAIYRHKSAAGLAFIPAPEKRKCLIPTGMKVASLVRGTGRFPIHVVERFRTNDWTIPWRRGS